MAAQQTQQIHILYVRDKGDRRWFLAGITGDTADAVAIYSRLLTQHDLVRLDSAVSEGEGGGWTREAGGNGRPARLRFDRRIAKTRRRMAVV